MYEITVSVQLFKAPHVSLQFKILRSWSNNPMWWNHIRQMKWFWQNGDRGKRAAVVDEFFFIKIFMSIQKCVILSFSLILNVLTSCLFWKEAPNKWILSFPVGKMKQIFWLNLSKSLRLFYSLQTPNGKDRDCVTLSDGYCDSFMSCISWKWDQRFFLFCLEL